MPGEAEEALGLHFLDHGFPLEVLVTGIGDVPARDLTGHEGAVDFDAEPLAKLAVVGQGAPNAGDGCFEFDALFNTVAHDMQPPGCILIEMSTHAQPFGCFLLERRGAEATRY